MVVLCVIQVQPCGQWPCELWKSSPAAAFCSALSRWHSPLNSVTGTEEPSAQLGLQRAQSDNPTVGNSCQKAAASLTSVCAMLPQRWREPPLTAVSIQPEPCASLEPLPGPLAEEAPRFPWPLPGPLTEELRRSPDRYRVPALSSPRAWEEAPPPIGAAGGPLRACAARCGR